MDSIRDKYIFDVDILRSHELQYEKCLGLFCIRKLVLFPICTLFLDPIRRFIRRGPGLSFLPWGL